MPPFGSLVGKVRRLKKKIIKKNAFKQLPLPFSRSSQDKDMGKMGLHEEQSEGIITEGF